MFSFSFYRLAIIPKLTPTSVLDILIVAILIYQGLMILRGRRAFPILVGLVVLGLIYLGSAWAHLELLRSILAGAAPYTGLALVVMFQSELRRLLSRIGRTQFLRFGDTVRIEMKSPSGQTVFGAIEQTVEPHARRSA